MASEVDRFMDYTTLPHPVFGERTSWRCRICKASGGDEPALEKSASEMAEAHFAKVALHYSAARLMPSKEEKRSSLYRWLLDEMTVYGHIGPKDAASITTSIAESFYRMELQDRDEKIAQLKKRLAALEAK